MTNPDYNRSKLKTQAIALGYDPNKHLPPKILASGNELIADLIIKVAKENNIPLHQDARLASTLSLLEINSYIPVEVYETVAKIISYILSNQNHKVKDS
jgi:flagellar biosynthesis protein